MSVMLFGSLSSATAFYYTVIFCYYLESKFWLIAVSGRSENATEEPEGFEAHTVSAFLDAVYHWFIDSYIIPLSSEGLRGDLSRK